MDNFKRELYMRALTLLEQGEEWGICMTLLRTLRELGILHYDNIFEHELILEELLQTVFTEFFELDDGIKWNNNSDIPEAVPQQKGINYNWWYSTDLAPRIRILNCILNSH